MKKDTKLWIGVIVTAIIMLIATTSCTKKSCYACTIKTTTSIYKAEGGGYSLLGSDIKSTTTNQNYCEVTADDINLVKQTMTSKTTTSPDASGYIEVVNTCNCAEK